MTREEALTILNYCDEYFHIEAEYEAFCMARNALKERLHGEWTKLTIYESACSCCENVIDRQMFVELPNFCPNCGSDNRPRILDEAIDGEGKDGNVKEDEAKIISNMKYYVCCPMCDKEKCVRGTEECDAEKWEKEREGERND